MFSVVDLFVNFNSHAHVERDPVFDYSIENIHISTHTLTWSVTQMMEKSLENILFQLTRSRGA